MRKKESFMQGVLAILFSQVVIKIFGLAYKVYLTNKDGFGDAGNAIYNSGFQIYALFLTLSSIGVPGTVAKLVSEKVAVGNYNGAHKIFKIALVLFSFIGFLGTLILFFGAKYIASTVLQIPEAEYTLVALSPSVLFVAIAAVIRGYYNGLQNLAVTARSQALEQVFKTVLTVVVVELLGIMYGLDTTIMAAGANLATTLAAILNFIYLFRYYDLQKTEIWKEVQKNSNKHKVERSKKVLKGILNVSIPISLSAVIGAINRTIDGITVVRGLKTFLSETSAKIQYGILSGKIDTLIGLPLSFNVAFATALVPAVSSSKAIGDIETIKKRVSFSLLITILIGLPFTAILCVFSNPILKLLFPNASDGGMLLKISAFSVIFTVITQTVNGALQGIGKLVTPTIALSIGALVKLVLNLILIPIENIGILGAAISSVACHIVSFLIEFYVLNKNIKLNVSLYKFVIKPIFVTIIMIICSYAVYAKLFAVLSENIATILSIALAIIIYMGLIILFRVFSTEDIYSMPGGEKIYNFLIKIGIYSKKGKNA